MSTGYNAKETPTRSNSIIKAVGGGGGDGSTVSRRKSFSYKDGRLSVEQHISILLEDLSTLGTALKPTPAEKLVLEEAFLGLHYVWRMRIRDNLRNLDFEVCDRLRLALLPFLTRVSEAWRHEVTGRHHLPTHHHVSSCIPAVTIYYYYYHFYYYFYHLLLTSLLTPPPTPKTACVQRTQIPQQIHPQPSCHHVLCGVLWFTA